MGEYRYTGFMATTLFSPSRALVRNYLMSASSAVFTAPTNDRTAILESMVYLEAGGSPRCYTDLLDLLPASCDLNVTVLINKSDPVNVISQTVRMVSLREVDTYVVLGTSIGDLPVTMDYQIVYVGTRSIILHSSNPLADSYILTF